MVIEAGEQTLELRHRRRIGVGNFQISYQMGDDLGGWGDAAGFLQVIADEDQGDGTAIVTLRSSGELGTSRYLRLAVSASE